ncbi:YheC/YheD family protein [Paenibacillaceae bacterium]|nr:YheC/YheD family protein [Paenibacillaceae bacterium]
MQMELADESNLELHNTKPVMAILTVKDDVQLFRGNRNNFADLLKVGREVGFIAYVVTTKQLILSKKRIKGYVFSEDTQSWQQRTLPLPNVIYNRIPLREDEVKPSVRRKLALLEKHPRIRMFNPTFFNKWHLFEWLNQSKSTKPYVPLTRRLTSQAGLGRMLQKHSYLYLKPVSGKAGKGIMTLLLQPEKQMPYRLKIQEKKKSITYRCANLAELWTRVRRECGGEIYIVQRGIMLASFQNRSFDLRALVQKNQRGQWDITGIGARLAGTTSITTHVPRGGSIEDPEKLLISSFGMEHARKIYIRAKNTALLIARQVERGYGQQLGEMSMDLGVDKNGSIWFFEANSKPMKFDEPHIRKKSLERIFHYGLYLMKQTPGKAGGA